MYMSVISISRGRGSTKDTPFMRQAILLFTCLFGGERMLEYTACDSTEHKGQGLQQQPQGGYKEMSSILADQ
jgi:hypothetical protein